MPRRRTLFFPAEILGGPEVSLDLNTNEALQSSFGNIGIGENWSISFWYKLNTVDQFPHLISILPASFGSSSITVALNDENPGGSFLSVHLTDDTGFTFWEMRQPSNTEVENVWRFVVLTRDFSLPQNDSVKLYVDGILQSPILETAFTSHMNDSVNRRIRLGFPGILGFSLEGRMYNAGIWNISLSASEITEIYNSGDGRFDLSADSGNYTSSANLLHWWRLGFDSNDIGKDYGNHTVLIDVLDNAIEIDSSDIVNDFPGM